MADMIKPKIDVDPEEAERIMQGWAQESREFAAAHGMFSMELVQQVLAAQMEPSVQRSYILAKEALAPLDELVKSLRCVQRLQSLNQLNGKVNPDLTHENPDQVYHTIPSFHTRYQHSELLAEQSIIAGVRLNLSLYELSLLYCGAMFHDVGHSAFGHAGDELLVRNGYQGHEERGRDILFKDDVRLHIEALGIDVEQIFDVIKEKSYLGTLQKTFDTLSYLVLDSGMMQDPVYDDFGARVIGSIVGVDEETVVVSDTGPMQQLLEDRAYMSQWIYYCPIGKMTDAAIRKILSISFKRGLLSLDEVAKTNDHMMRMKIQSMTQRDPGASLFGGRYDERGKPYTDTPMRDCKELFSMTNGFFNSGTWKRYRFSEKDRGKIDDFFFRHRNNKRIVEQAFVVEPFDYTKKTLNVKTEDGETHTLHCQDYELRPEDKQYILYTPRPR